MASRRNLVFLVLVALAVGIAVAVTLFADSEAQKIVATAPEEPAEEVEPIDMARCEEAQVEFETLWDQSIENPEDLSYEEKLEIALSEVNAACGIE